MLGVCLGLDWGAASRLQGQEHEGGKSTTIEWLFGQVKSGWCLHFLIAPDLAGRDLPQGHSPAQAGTVGGLLPAVATLIASETAYQNWTPAQLCTVVAGSLDANEKRFDQGDGGEPLILVWWSVAATGPEGATMASRYLGVNSTRLKQLMQASLLEVDRVKARRESLPDSPDHRLRIDLEGATLYFDSHVTPDTVPTERPTRWEWAAQGPRNLPWKGVGHAAPDSAGWVAGALRIQGKRGLAAILAESPIRIFGSGFAGGTFTLQLTR